MLISELVRADLVDANLKSSTKEEVLAEIVDRLCAKDLISAKDAILQALLDREKKGSTGIGGAVAVPHARVEGISGVILFIGVSQQGIDFGALDGNPVKLVMFLLSPVSQTHDSLKVLANLARMVNDKYFKSLLMNSQTDEELFSVLKQSAIDKEQSFILK